MTEIQKSKKRKAGSYLLSGLILTYFAFSDDEFIILYNGIALAAGLTAFVFAYLAYTKKTAD